MKIAVLGLGLMGGGMAANVIKAGFDVSVYNRNPDKAAPFAGMARIAATPAEAVVDADVVVSMVADDKAAQSVWDSALPNIKAGAVCIESSTLSPGWIKGWAARVESQGAFALDAPVTGSKAAANAGELIFVIGGSEAAIDKARPALEAMSKAIMRIGPTGSGSLLKLINNFLCGVQLASFAEALKMVERGGLDQDKAMELLTMAAPASPLIKLVSPRMISGDYTPHFPLQLMAKDLTYATTEGKALGVDMVTGMAALSQFEHAVDAGFGEQDFAAIAAYVKSL